MKTIVLSGHVGPLDALRLRDRLDREVAVRRPLLHVDLTKVESIHPAAIAAILRAHRRARRASGSVRVTSPDAGPAAHTIRLVTLLQPLK